MSKKKEEINVNEIIVTNGSKKYRLSELLNVRMVIEIYGVSRMTVYNWLGKAVESSNTEVATNYDGKGLTDNVSKIITYPNGTFPNAFKDKATGKIYVPVTDVQNHIRKKIGL